MTNGPMVAFFHNIVSWWLILYRTQADYSIPRKWGFRGVPQNPSKEGGTSVRGEHLSCRAGTVGNFAGLCTITEQVATVGR